MKKNYSQERNVITTYYGHRADIVLKVNRAKDPDVAVEHAFKHMHRNHYQAFVAEVYNDNTGELYAVILHTVTGEIRTLFRYDPMTKVVIMDFDPKMVREVIEHKDSQLVKWVEENLLQEEVAA